MPPDTRIADTATQILSQLVTRLAALGLDVPDRRYVHAGQIAIDFAGKDCADELVVAWADAYQGTPEGEIRAPIGGGAPSTALFQILLTRCVPTMDANTLAPSASDLNDAGVQIMTDAFTLLRAVFEAESDGDLVTEGCSLSTLGRLIPYGPEGGVGGSVLQLLVNLV